MHVIHLTYQQLRQPTLSVLRKLTLAYSQAKPSNVKPIFYISYNLLHTILKKKKKRMVVWMQKGRLLSWLRG